MFCVNFVNLHTFLDPLLLVYRQHCGKSICIRSYSGRYYPAFGLNTERIYTYSVHVRENADQNNSKYASFLRSTTCENLQLKSLDSLREQEMRIWKKPVICMFYSLKATLWSAWREYFELLIFEIDWWLLIEEMLSFFGTPFINKNRLEFRPFSIAYHFIISASTKIGAWSFRLIRNPSTGRKIS